MSRCQKAGSFTPYLLINPGNYFALLSSSLSSFPCVFFFFLCRTGFSQLCSPRRAFSEQGPLRLIKSASFFSGRRFQRATTETCHSHVWVGVDAVVWVLCRLWLTAAACLWWLSDWGRSSRHAKTQHVCRCLGSDRSCTKKERNYFLAVLKDIFGIFLLLVNWKENVGSFCFICTIETFCNFFFTHINEANSHLLNQPVNLPILSDQGLQPCHMHIVCVSSYWC